MAVPTAPPPPSTPADSQLPAGARPRPQLLVVVDGSAAGNRRLVWALQEAARRDATVVAVAALDPGAAEDLRADAQAVLDAQLRHATAEAGVRSRSRTALLDPAVVAALTDAARGSELVVAGSHRLTVLRPVQPRPPVRRPLTRRA